MGMFVWVMTNTYGKLEEVNRNIYRSAVNGHLCFEIGLGNCLIPELLPRHIDFNIFVSLIKYLSKILCWQVSFLIAKVGGGRYQKSRNHSVFALCEKCSNTEFYLIRLFPYSDWIRSRIQTEYGDLRTKYEPEKTSYLDIFHAVLGK